MCQIEYKLLWISRRKFFLASGKPKKTANSREVEKQGTAEKHRGKEAEKIRKAEKQRSKEAEKSKKKAEKQMKQKSKRNNGEKNTRQKIKHVKRKRRSMCAAISRISCVLRVVFGDV